MTDIQECTLGLDYCDENGVCQETDGSYECVCNPGYELYTSDGFNGFTLADGETGLLPGDVYYIDHSCVRKSHKCSSKKVSSDQILQNLEWCSSYKITFQNHC